MAQYVRLVGPSQRALAKALIDRAPLNSMVKISEEKRSLQQNARLWAMLSDIARAKPDGRVHVPEVWKQLAMHACGHEVSFENGLNGKPFPTGFHSSRLNKAEMSELIEFLYSYGAEKGVVWSEPEPAYEGRD